MKMKAVVFAALLVLGATGLPGQAQDGTPPPGPEMSLRSSTELDQLLGPIALYPDPLIALILPAATDPSQIVMADRYLSNGGDPNQVSQQPWDPSVQGLAHYPTVLKWMDDNITWTTELGAAFASQQSDVMDSVQRLRGQAQSLGNLQSTPQENVVSDDGDIDIDPSNPDDIYVPDYSADEIYSQPGIYCSFGIGFPIGGWLGFDWDWRHHHLISWGHGHERPAGWWQRPPNVRRQAIASERPPVFRPQTHFARPIVAGGGDRGYETRPVSRGFNNSYLRPSRGPVVRSATEAPRVSEAPRVNRTEIGRAPEMSRPAERREPSESAFGGSQSSREVRASSSRGEESRSMGASSSHPGGSGRR